MLGALKSMFGGGNDSVVDALRRGAVIVDVRTPAEYRGGHVANSKNIPLNELGAALQRLSPTTPVVFCCASGGRSGQAASMASSAGLEAYNGGPWTAVNRMVAELE